MYEIFFETRPHLHPSQYWTVLLMCHSSFQSDLDNLTWHEIQRKVREVQLEQQMCIHKRDLTELDIYHRILRYHVVYC
jgi:autophagy-related protein 9